MEILTSKFSNMKSKILLNTVSIPLEIRNTFFENVKKLIVNPIKNNISFIKCNFESLEMVEMNEEKSFRKAEVEQNEYNPTNKHVIFKENDFSSKGYVYSEGYSSYHYVRSTFFFI